MTRLLIGLLLAGTAAEAQDRFPWPSFRGPSASGIADGQDPPTEWSAETGHNIQWKTEVRGLGHSSPVVWGDRLFVTSAVSDDPDPVFRYGTDGRQDRRSDREPNTWFVHAVDRDTGEILWEREAASGAPTIQRHPKNSYSSATPATDGETLVTLFATGALQAWDLDGNRRWAVELGPIDAGASYDDSYQWGAASSPIIWRDLAIVLADQQRGSFLAAFDLETGEEVWRVERDLISSFGTPTVHTGADRPELITNGAGTMHGYDPATGSELWRMTGSSFNTTPTPVVQDGLIYLTSGYRFRPIFAVRLGASGDISLPEGASSSDDVAWSSQRDGPYMASPLVYQGRLYVVSAGGVLTVFDSGTGERLYRRRIGERGGAYTASPVAADGRVYLTSEDGDVFVIRAGAEYELLSVNPMGAVCLATPALSDGQVLVRTASGLVAATEGVAPTRTASGDSFAFFPREPGAAFEIALDDWEDGDLFSHSGVRWHTFTNGASSADASVVSPGADGQGSAARLDGVLEEGAARGPLAQLYQPFDRGAAPVNLEDLGRIRLSARGSHPFELTVRCRGVEYGVELPVTDEWSEFHLGPERFAALAGRPDPPPWSGRECDGIYFSRRGASDLGSFWFELDGLSLSGTEEASRR